MAWLHFTSEIDLTGIGTVVLAVATAVLAGRTAAAVRQGNTEIERANRPVLVPIVDRTREFIPRGSAGFPLEPTPDSGSDRYYVPVSNIGMGPALRVTSTLSFGDQHGKPSTHGIDTTCNVNVAGISHTSLFTVLVFPSKPSAHTGFALMVEYEDVAGKKWRTIARYDSTDRIYQDVSIVEL